eukprot:360870-Chlamydomonas_euryale.AAC.8
MDKCADGLMGLVAQVHTRIEGYIGEGLSEQNDGHQYRWIDEWIDGRLDGKGAVGWERGTHMSIA